MVDDIAAPSPRASTGLVQLAEIEAARSRLAGVSRVTPVERPSGLAALCGRRVALKAEHHQRTGSFKLRGAYHLISSLPDDVRHVVAASAGNHVAPRPASHDLHAARHPAPQGAGHQGLRR